MASDAGETAVIENGPEDDARNDTGRVALPYISFDTFNNFLDSLADRPLPPRVDRSLMVGMAGGTQTQMIGALQLFGLVTETRDVKPTLNALVASADLRGPRLREVAALLYGGATELAIQHATADQLAEWFRSRTGYTGSTLRKAVSFYLNLAKFCELPVSPYFRPPAQASNSKTRSNPRRTRTTAAQAPPAASTANVPTEAESRSVHLASGGTVTVSCTTAFLALTREDREFVFKLVDELIDYERATHPGGET